MKQRRLLLCTDMDRTVIPNGTQSEHPDARLRFRQFCQHPDVALVYVTGRDKKLVQQAIKNYHLPLANYAITDVGTKIYVIEHGSWVALDAWEFEIGKSWNGKNHHQIKQILSHIPELLLQESAKQNTHKVSYYLPLYSDKEGVIQQMRTCLKDSGIEASVIWSIDELKKIGLIDVLPQNANKLHAIEFLQHYLGYTLEETVFAGDSGNDLPVLVSPIHSILVDNASAEIKATAQQLAKENGHEQALYIAKPMALAMNANYSAGVLEGIWHFAPQFHDVLRPN